MDCGWILGGRNDEERSPPLFPSTDGNRHCVVSVRTALAGLGFGIDLKAEEVAIEGFHAGDVLAEDDDIGEVEGVSSLLPNTPLIMMGKWVSTNTT